MPTVLEVLGGLLLLVGAVTLAAGAVQANRHDRPTPALAPTIFAAAGFLLLSIGWLTSSGAPAGSADAIRSGTLISAAVLGLYALWLNDQRRRTEQERLETEKERGAIERNRLAKELEQLGMERVRIADERFTKAIELLGDESDRVRVGALILLDGLARSRPDLIPDVIDQVCGYLRGPLIASSSGPADQERRVRLRAQRVLSAVVQRASAIGVPTDVDLTDASLHCFRLDGGTIGVLRLDGANLTGPTTLRGVVLGELVMANCTADDDVVIERDGQRRGWVGRLVLRGNGTAVRGRFQCRCDLGSVEIDSVDFRDGVELTDLTVRGCFSAHAGFTRLTLAGVTFALPPEPEGRSIDLFECTFAGPASFDGVEVHGTTRFAGVRFDGGLDLNTRFHRRVTAEQALVIADTESELPDGWRLGDYNTTHRKLIPPVR